MFADETEDTGDGEPPERDLPKFAVFDENEDPVASSKPNSDAPFAVFEDGDAAKAGIDVHGNIIVRIIAFYVCTSH